MGKIDFVYFLSIYFEHFVLRCCFLKIVSRAREQLGGGEKPSAILTCAGGGGLAVGKCKIIIYKHFFILCLEEKCVNFTI